MPDSLESRLAEALREMVAWDARWPSNVIHGASRFQECHDELAALIAKARALLAELEGRGKA